MIARSLGCVIVVCSFMSTPNCIVRRYLICPFAFFSSILLYCLDFDFLLLRRIFCFVQQFHPHTTRVVCEVFCLPLLCFSPLFSANKCRVVERLQCSACYSASLLFCYSATIVIPTSVMGSNSWNPGTAYRMAALHIPRLDWTNIYLTSQQTKEYQTVLVYFLQLVLAYI